MKIKVRLIDENCKIEKLDKGDWFDLKVRCNVNFIQPQAGTQYTKGIFKYRDVTFSQGIIPLGVAMKLPEGYEAIESN